MWKENDLDWAKRSIPDHFAVLSGFSPPDELGFQSDSPQILCNSSNTPWHDDGMHAHGESDGAYLVLEGTITLQIQDEIINIESGEICFVPKGVFHAVTKVTVPYRGFVLRAPSVQDKIYPLEE